MSPFFLRSFFRKSQIIFIIPLSSRTYIHHSSFVIHYEVHGTLADPISLFTAHTARLAEVASS